jgi:hypothetical protein
MENLTQAQSAKMDLTGLTQDADMFDKLVSLGAKKEIDDDTIDFIFTDNSIVRYTVDETFITL